MPTVPWSEDINFASALLLHSCLTVLFKEIANAVVVLWRMSSDVQLYNSKFPTSRFKPSFVLDAYTSVFSRDADGEQAELYFTNTGLLLLAVTLVASVTMNLFLPDLVLNMIVAGTFGLCFIASLVVGKVHITLPIAALRRAGRFIWSDTPFVNFFTLVYIATVLHGNSTLHLQDYVTFRSIAVAELVFMKAKLAATDPEMQERLVRRLIKSEWGPPCKNDKIDTLNLETLPRVSRQAIITFQTSQRLSVMLFKPSVGYARGCLQGPNGPCRCRIPASGHYLYESDRRLMICRTKEDTLLLVDRLPDEIQGEKDSKLTHRAHGILLRQLGKVRVVYAIEQKQSIGDLRVFHSNINLVTGVSQNWLSELMEGPCVEEVVIGYSGSWLV